MFFDKKIGKAQQGNQERKENTCFDCEKYDKSKMMCTRYNEKMDFYDYCSKFVKDKTKENIEQIKKEINALKALQSIGFYNLSIEEHSVLLYCVHNDILKTYIEKELMPFTFNYLKKGDSINGIQNFIKKMEELIDEK